MGTAPERGGRPRRPERAPADPAARALIQARKSLWLDAQRLLFARAPDDAEEAAALAAHRAALARGAAAFERSGSPDHFTASAYAVDRFGTHALLLGHRKLGRMLQPGGHFEPLDATVAGAAARELREEALPPGSEEPSLELGGLLLDVDSHAVPASEREGAHRHLDLRLLFRLPEGYLPWANPEEATEARWVELRWLAAHAEEAGHRRMARKALAAAKLWG